MAYNIFFLILGLQSSIMLVDEFYFHFRREMPKWERRGHPLDTLFLLLPLGLLLFLPFNQIIFPYLFLSIFSCLFITKDEWVHARHCTGAEQWLHSLLFVIHPILLFFAPAAAEKQRGLYVVTLIMIGLFGLYQFVFWNFIKGDHARTTR